MNKVINKIDQYFEITKRGSTLQREIVAGIVVFLAMVYILPVNVAIFNATGMKSGAVFAATAISSGIASLMMGLIARYPLALSTGMGMNSFIAFTVCGEVLGYTWQEALTLVLIASLLFFVLSVTNIRWRLVSSIPMGLKNLITCSLGGFLAFVGLKGAGIIKASTDTLVTLGDLSNPTVLLGLFGIILAFILYNIKGKINNFAVVISLITVATIGYLLHLLNIDGMPSFSNQAGNILDIKETCFVAFKNFAVLKNPSSYAVIFTILFVNFFDTSATIISVGQQIGLMNNDGVITDGVKAGIADSSSTIISTTLGTSPITSFAESNIAVEMGARTGIVGVIVGILFFLSLLIYPVFSIFSIIDGYSPITSLALVLVGTMMFSNFKNINWDDKVLVITGFIMFIMMILTYSISDGIGIAFILYILMMIVAKRRKEISFVTYIIGIFFIINFIIKFTVLK